MLKFYTASMSIKTELPCLDITVKNKREPAFAPTWEMVMALKDRLITEEQYTNLYYKLMRKSYVQYQKRWRELLNMDVVVLKCFCDEDEFCHRFVLADILVRLGATYMGEIKRPVPKTSIQEDVDKIKETQKLVTIYTSRLLTPTPGMQMINMNKERAFAPSRILIEKNKNNEITKEEYMNEYYKELEKSSNRYRKVWLDLIKSDTVVLKCYNESEDWCNPRYFLANVLKSLGAEYLGEIKGNR